MGEPRDDDFHDADERAADVFALGMVLAQLASLRQPYFDVEPRAAVSIRVAVRRGLRPTLPDTAPRDLCVVVRACWQSLPALRASINDVVDSLVGVQRSLAASSAAASQRNASTTLVARLAATRWARVGLELASGDAPYTSSAAAATTTTTTTTTFAGLPGIEIAPISLSRLLQSELSTISLALTLSSTISSAGRSSSDDDVDDDSDGDSGSDGDNGDVDSTKNNIAVKSDESTDVSLSFVFEKSRESL